MGESPKIKVLFFFFYISTPMFYTSRNRLVRRNCVPGVKTFSQFEFTNSSHARTSNLPLCHLFSNQRDASKHTIPKDINNFNQVPRMVHYPTKEFRTNNRYNLGVWVSISEHLHTCFDITSAHNPVLPALQTTYYSSKRNCRGQKEAD